MLYSEGMDGMRSCLSGLRLGFSLKLSVCVFLRSDSNPQHSSSLCVSFISANHRLCIHMILVLQLELCVVVPMHSLSSPLFPSVFSGCAFHCGAVLLSSIARLCLCCCSPSVQCEAGGCGGMASWHLSDSNVHSLSIHLTSPFFLSTCLFLLSLFRVLSCLLFVHSLPSPAASDFPYVPVFPFCLRCAVMQIETVPKEYESTKPSLRAKAQGMLHRLATFSLILGAQDFK